LEGVDFAGAVIGAVERKVERKERVRRAGGVVGNRELAGGEGEGVARD
jgi:hypothetical protein